MAGSANQSNHLQTVFTNIFSFHGSIFLYGEKLKKFPVGPHSSSCLAGLDETMTILSSYSIASARVWPSTQIKAEESLEK